MTNSFIAEAVFNMEDDSTRAGGSVDLLVVASK